MFEVLPKPLLKTTTKELLLVELIKGTTMKKKRDVLLEQIAENSRESIVFFVTGYASEQPIGLGTKYSALSGYIEIGVGFFVAPDKIVSTIGTLAGADAVAAISVDRFTKAVNNSGKGLFGKRNHPQISEEEKYTIEGVTAFDSKNNLALLKIAEAGVPLPLGNTDAVQIDEKIYTLGYRDDLIYKGAAGTLQNRYKDNKWFQIKTQFYSGNGGGPVLNRENEVIGVLAYGTGSVTGDSNVTVATAISSNVLKELLANSGGVMSLEQLQRNSGVRAYVLETQADDKAELYENGSAIRDYYSALKLNPELVEIYSKRGILKTRIGNFRGASKDFDKMIQINPEHIFAYNNRASAKVQLGDEQGALDDLNKAIQINPEYAMAYTNLGGVKRHIAETKMDEGNIVEAQRYYQEAIDDYIKCLALNPRNSLVRKHLRDTKDTLKFLNFVPKKD